MAQRKYSRQEVDAILGRAIEREDHGELAHEDLLAAAREIGIPEDAIETAAIEIAAERSERTELMELRRDQWRGFVAHLIPYVMVNALLVTINVLTTHFPWAVFPALGWGIGLASHLWAVLFPSRQHQQYHLEQLRSLDGRREMKQRVRSNARELDLDDGLPVVPPNIERHTRVVLDDAEPTTSVRGESDTPRRKRE